MIRDADYTDVPVMVELGAKMHVESVYQPFDYDHDKVTNLIDRLVYSDEGIALVSVREDDEIVGGMIGEIVPHYFGNSKMAFDYAVFMHPDYRGTRDGYLLIREFTLQSIRRGAVHIVSGTSTGVNPEVTERLYKKLGYDDIGKLFTYTVEID